MAAGNGGAEDGKAATAAGNGGDDGGKAAMAACSGGGGGNGGDDGGKATMAAGNGGDDGGKATMAAGRHSINALMLAPGKASRADQRRSLVSHLYEYDGDDILELERRARIVRNHDPNLSAMFARFDQLRIARFDQLLAGRRW